MTTPAAGMDAGSFEQFLEQLQRYVRERLVPAEREVIAADAVPQAIRDELREMGLFALSTPEEFGGAGMNAAQYVRTIHCISYAMPAYRAAISINTGMVCSAFKNGGTAEQKAEWLPRLANGEIACFALTEPGSGSDSAAMQTMAVKTDNGWVLNGTKRYITNGPVADTFNVMARTNPEIKGARGISAFIVEKGTPGITLGPIDKKMGQAGSLTCDVIFEDCPVPAANLIGKEGQGFITAMKVLDRGRLHIAGISVGVAERLIRDALQYAMQRKQFGVAIAEHQLIQAMLADSKTEAYAARCMVLETARRRDAGQNVSTESAACKLFATEMVGRVADRAVQIHGGAGYISEYAVERFYRDVRLFRLYEGTSQIQQLIIARNMIKDAT